MRSAEFKYTFPIEKAERREDGLFLTGLATGPELDGDGDRLAPEVMFDFAKQINSQGGIPLTERIPYRDAHAKDGVWRDLGWVTKAWVTDSGHLGVEVQLDEESEAARFLHKQVQRGKQFGMSVGGKVIDWGYEYVAEIGKSVRTFRNVVLNEISNTTKPSWSPSFGTVIAKAIQDAEATESDAPGGENVENELQTEQETDTPAIEETPAVEPAVEVIEEAPEAPATEAAEEVAEETEVAPEADIEDTEVPADEAVAEETADETPADETPVVEPVDEAVAEETVTETPDSNVVVLSEALTGLREYISNMLSGLSTAAPVLVTKSVSEDETEPTLEKALLDRDSAIVTQLAQIEELTKSLSQATARIEELENSPAGDDSPELVGHHELTREEIQKTLSDMAPSERLRVGLRARYSGDA